MNIAVSGATGFIGKNIAKRLSDEGVKVFPIVRSTSNISLLSGYDLLWYSNDIEPLINEFKNNNIVGVIHLASEYVVQHNPKDVVSIINSNIEFPANLIEAAVKSSCHWFLNTGSYWQNFESDTYRAVNLYAATKQAFEDILDYYCDAFSIKSVTLRLNDTYGPGDTRRKIFNIWLEHSESGMQLDMSAGEQVVDFTYIDDVVQAFLHAVKCLEDGRLPFKDNHEVYAVSSGENMKLKELAMLYKKVSGKDLNIQWGKLPYREREVFMPWQNGIRLPGWSPEVMLEQGISKLFKNGENYE